MGNDPIYCLNNTPEKESECIYKECQMYSEELDLCKLELLKAKPKKATTERKPIRDEPQRKSETREGGTRFISSLKEGEKSSKQNPLNLKGELVFDPIQKDVDTQYGPNTVTSIILKDDSGEVKISFWGEGGNKIMDFSKGDKLFFEGLYLVKEFFDNKPQVDAGKYFKVAKI